MFGGGQRKAGRFGVHMRSFFLSLFREVAEGFDELILDPVDRIFLLEE